MYQLDVSDIYKHRLMNLGRTNSVNLSLVFEST